MRWASALSERRELESAVGEAGDALRRELGDLPAHLVVAFASTQHSGALAALSDALQRELPDALVLGCSARSVIGAGRELEESTGLALAAAHLPRVGLHPFQLDSADGVGGAEAAEEWVHGADLAGEHDPAFLLLADPFTSDSQAIAHGLDRPFRDAVAIGGLASGGEGPGENVLLLADQVHRQGCVGVALTGDVRVDPVIAQGCRPVGSPMFVTRASGNMIHELDGEPPTTILGELFAQASPRDQSLFRTSLFLGVEMRPAQLEYGQGDFLVRNLLGADNDSGAIAVAADLAERQVVQFHLRDGETASRDLHLRLSDYQDRLHDDDAQAAPSGALLFSCLGRGEQLYGVPNHDIDAFGKHLGKVPLAGFFCNGELGPVGGTPFLHGYTSAFAIFRSRNRQA